MPARRRQKGSRLPSEEPCEPSRCSGRNDQENLLSNGDYDPTFETGETGEAMKAALDKQTWDAVIADNTMPSFSATAALTLFKERGLDLPFIIVSGTIGEDTAVEAMKAGTHDYLMIDNFRQLVAAVERELKGKR